MLSRFRRAAFTHLRPVLLSEDVPFNEAYEAADELRRTIYYNPHQEADMLPVLIDCFQTRWPDEARAMTLCGRASIRLAWNHVNDQAISASLRPGIEICSNPSPLEADYIG